MSDRVLMFEARGEPCGQPRPRFVGRGRKPVSTLRGSKAALWRLAVERACYYDAPSKPLVEYAEAVEVEMVFSFASKGRHDHGSAHRSKPDADNLAKLVLDVMQDSGMIQDDKAVSKLTVRKMWNAYGAVSVTVKPAVDRQAPAIPDTEGLGSGSKPEWLQ